MKTEEEGEDRKEEGEDRGEEGKDSGEDSWEEKVEIVDGEVGVSSSEPE